MEIMEYLDQKDIEFCEAEQTAYTESCNALMRCANYTEWLEDVSEVYASEINPKKFWEQLVNAHEVFYSRIAGYFEKKYHLEFNLELIKGDVMPENPDSGFTSFDNFNAVEWLEKSKKYTEAVRSLRLDYKDIVQSIANQIGGDPFQDYAYKTLLNRVRDALWCYRKATPAFSVKGNKLILSSDGGFCGGRDHYYAGDTRYKITESGRAVFEALAYYETGLFNNAGYFAEICDPWELEESEFEYTADDRKVSHVKLYKNGRIDIKFRTKEYTDEFIKEFGEPDLTMKICNSRIA